MASVKELQGPSTVPDWLPSPGSELRNISPKDESVKRQTITCLINRIIFLK